MLDYTNLLDHLVARDKCCYYVSTRRSVGDDITRGIT